MMNRSQFKDLFSKQSQDYAKFRPRYPEGLFKYLISLVEDRECAWDCGTGSGQSALGLVPYFNQIVATDPSRSQLDQATRHPKIKYQVGSGEDSKIPAHQITLTTVAQAFHWIDCEKFYEEVRRVSKPNGSIVALWCYGLAEIEPKIDAQVKWYYSDVIGQYWEPERRLVETQYQTVPFPFSEIKPPPFYMELSWNLEHLLGYLGTWSSTQTALKKTGNNPIEQVVGRLTKEWGSDPHQFKKVRWELAFRIGSL